jgi:hypothetical protein
VDRLYSIIAGSAGPGGRARRYTLVYGDAVPLARTTDGAEAWSQFASDLSLWVAILAPARVFVHAGVVAWRGRAIVLPGRALAGKSTLVAALVRAGATYYSDEWAVLDARGRVHPYPRPLSIRATRPGVPDALVPVESIGGRAGRQPLPVGLVVMTRFRPGAKWRPKPLSRGEGALALIEHSVQTHRDPVRVLNAFRQVVANALILEGHRGQAEEVAPALLAQIDALGPARRA